MVEVHLPCGFDDGGAWHKTLWIRPLNGLDEILLGIELASELPAARATVLLSRCAHHRNEPVSVEFARSLTTGDREALLLHLWRISRGPSMPCVVRCNQCMEAMDLPLSVDELLLEPYAMAERVLETEVEHGSIRYRIRYRLPNGGDQEEAARLARRDADRAARLVLERCIEQAAGDGAANSVGCMDALPEAVLSHVSELMGMQDPQAEIVLRGDCCNCGKPFVIAFDAGQFLLREVEQARGNLERQVHLLAYYYQWSEHDILSMSASRRASYTKCLLESLAERRRQ